MTAPGTRQPNLNRRFDKTQLKSTHHGLIVHRDYAAHFFRWGFARKAFITPGETRILDIGCGQEAPLARTLAASVGRQPKIYVGIDYNKISKPFKAKWADVRDEFNFIDNHAELVVEFGAFDLITCFEVIEHMHPEDGSRLLENACELLEDEDSRFLLSTPVFNGRQAANHIHEYEIGELQEAIEAAGLEVVERRGTFASINDIKKACTAEERKIMDELREYYDNDVVSCFLAPKYPDASRNNLWVLKRGDT